jgi:hypothetical protein
MSNKEVPEEWLFKMSCSSGMSIHPLSVNTQEDYISHNINVSTMNAGNNNMNKAHQPDEISSSIQLEQYNNRCNRQETQSMSHNMDIKKWFGDKLQFNHQWLSGEYTDT